MLESIMLVISDDPSLIDPIGGVIRSIEGLKHETLANIEAAHSYESWDRVALVLIHLKRSGPDDEIVRLLRMIAGARRPVATLVVADRLDSDQGPALLRMGVADYLGRPLDLARLSHLADVLTVRARNASRGPAAGLADRPERAPAVPTPFDPSAEDDQLMDQVRRVASQNTTILLGGETGTGKTRLARRVHELSNRRAEPFVVINCGSLTASQLETEMFGHARGSLEGPRKDRPGKFAEVGRGTLFLDEIDAMPMSLQPRLLKVVEDRVFETGGANKAVPIQARLIAASNRDLQQEVEDGQFRSDLYYRLNVIGLQLPPLRERRGSISSLASTFIDEASDRDGAGVESISEPALRTLEEYDWPGNIRELKNTIERAVALASGPEIVPDDLPEAITRRDLATIRRAAFRPVALPVPIGANSTLAEIKRDAELARITEALEKHSNNRLRAACELGISRMTLYKKLYKYGLMHPNQAAEGGPGN
jgi:two-component system, NtrC family, response regulator HydG